jgi:hypothetical protein
MSGTSSQSSTSQVGRPAELRFCMVTPSYSNDFELARQLCETADRFLAPEVEHILVVPERDRRLFGALQGPRRRVISKQEVLAPLGFRKLPLPSRVRIPGLVDRRIAEQWWHPGLGRVTGWVSQQLIKLAANSYCSADVIIFADSDITFIRPLDTSAYMDGSLVRMHKVPLPEGLPEHVKWNASSRRLLGVSRSDAPRSDYIGPMVNWSAANLRRLLAHIEAVNHRPWYEVVIDDATVSEYMLYGVYCDEVLGLGQAGHAAWVNDLVLSIWGDADVGEAAALRHRLEASHATLLIQSYVRLDPAQRARIRESIVPA